LLDEFEDSTELVFGVLVESVELLVDSADSDLVDVDFVSSTGLAEGALPELLKSVAYQPDPFN
jgi:hypothetical protein